MILGFMQFFDTKKTQPTHFREKILAGVNRVWIKDTESGREFASNNSWGAKMASDFIKSHTPLNTKLHTLRFDPFDRWKAGKTIQMAYGVRTKNYQQFNKGIPELEKCVSVQRVRLKWLYKNKYIETTLPIQKITGPHGTFEYYPAVWIDKKQLTDSEIETLARNDGFDSTEDFFKWFKNDFAGKIIHFTDFKY